MKTKIISLQFAYFLRDIIERPDLEFESINKDLLNAFDDIPQTFPVPRELPPEVPVKTLRSTNGQYTCVISRSRIDFHVTRIDDFSTNTELLKDFNIKVAALTKSITEKQEVNRFGIVARYFHEDRAPINTLQKKYFSQHVAGSNELSLRFNKQGHYSGYHINDIVEISAGEIFFNNQPRTGILVQRDINNTITSGHVITSSTLNEISKRYSPKISEAEIMELL
ncbi:hypothetical protein [Vibrio vulnificus]|uniref:hypothetical protein n=1 Tax=Vibrio vulnificus TaxID=672 RepID=UPI000D3E2375|nr:hypothetical protein [Vibrio vulnificus]EJT0554693.1 hypothetical protein [Vibrio vulnificus]MBN8141614.1 hypothetical protein [Vibrio vulnificus]MBN8150902.1 hypothetical protein [Vibrio vulnificus]NIG90203.1 hypothetical protein [Vibrio vulnificus]PUZ81485.1 hypothetical protein DC357_13685 [Vibrio vulnificus]